MHRLRALIPLVVLSGFALQASPGYAYCGAPAPEVALRDAPIAFIGTVNTVSNRGRSAVVTVEETLKGPQQPSTVEVNGGPKDPNGGTGEDRTFQSNTKYLFFPTNAQSPFSDSLCTATSPYTAGLAQTLAPDIRSVNRLASTGSKHLRLDLAIGSGIAILGICIFLRTRVSTRSTDAD